MGVEVRAVLALVSREAMSPRYYLKRVFHDADARDMEIFYDKYTTDPMGEGELVFRDKEKILELLGVLSVLIGRRRPRHDNGHLWKVTEQAYGDEVDPDLMRNLETIETALRFRGRSVEVCLQPLRPSHSEFLLYDTGEYPNEKRLDPFALTVSWGGRLSEEAVEEATGLGPSWRPPSADEGAGGGGFPGLDKGECSSVSETALQVKRGLRAAQAFRSRGWTHTKVLGTSRAALLSFSRIFREPVNGRRPPLTEDLRSLTIRLIEDTRRGWGDPDRFRVELLSIPSLVPLRVLTPAALWSELDAVAAFPASEASGTGTGGVELTASKSKNVGKRLGRLRSGVGVGLAVVGVLGMAALAVARARQRR